MHCMLNRPPFYQEKWMSKQVCALYAEIFCIQCKLMNIRFFDSRMLWFWCLYDVLVIANTCNALNINLLKHQSILYSTISYNYYIQQISLNFIHQYVHMYFILLNLSLRSNHVSLVLLSIYPHFQWILSLYNFDLSSFYSYYIYFLP